MAHQRAISELFQMCKKLQAEVDNLKDNIIWGLEEEVTNLKAVVKALQESNNKKSVAVKEVVTNINVLSAELDRALDANDDKFDQLSAEVEEIKEHVKSAEVKQKTSVSKIKALEASVSQGRTFSVLRSQPSHQRYEQFRGRRPRICYNCRKPGHEARNCDKPNPRMDTLKATAKTLSVENVEKAEEEEMCPWELQYQASLKTRNGS